MITRFTTSGAFSGATAVPSLKTRARGPVWRNAVLLRCCVNLASDARASRSSARTSASVGAPGLGASSVGSTSMLWAEPAPSSSTTCAFEFGAFGCSRWRLRPSRAASGVSTTSSGSAGGVARAVARGLAAAAGREQRRAQQHGEQGEARQPAASGAWCLDFHSEYGIP